MNHTKTDLKVGLACSTVTFSTIPLTIYRVPAVHGKPGKSWNSEIIFPGLEKLWKII
jgi:hypothetical protein